MLQQYLWSSRSRQIGFWAAAAASLVSLSLVFSSSSGSRKLLALCSTLGAGVAALSVKQGSSRAPETSKTGMEENSPQLYTSKWTMDDRPERGILVGRAKALDFGDRAIIRQEESGGGTYVLELKRVGQSVTGVWWFYGGCPPQGMFRGSVLADRTIQATWQGPEGNGSGTWELTPEDNSQDAAG